MTSKTEMSVDAALQTDAGQRLSSRARAMLGRISFRDFGPTFALLALIVFFAFTSRQFLTLENARVLLESSAIPIVLVVGLTFILLQGSIDLSIGGVMAASSMAVSLLIANTITPYDFGWWAIVAGMLVGTGFGLANGLLYTLLRMPSLIVTLATWFIGLGVATLLFPGRQPQILDERLMALVLDKSAGVSKLVYFALIVAIAGYLLQKFTQFGRVSLAIGYDEKTTRQSGLPVRFYKILAFALMGLLSGLAGVMISAQLGVGNPTAGTGYLFPAISAAVVGGTLLSGGRGGIIHSMIGVFVLEVLRNGMVQLGVDPYLRHVIEGATIVGALVIGNWHLRSRLRVVK